MAVVTFSSQLNLIRDVLRLALPSLDVDRIIFRTARQALGKTVRGVTFPPVSFLSTLQPLTPSLFCLSSARFQRYLVEAYIETIRRERHASCVYDDGNDERDCHSHRLRSGTLKEAQKQEQEQEQEPVHEQSQGQGKGRGQGQGQLARQQSNPLPFPQRQKQQEEENHPHHQEQYHLHHHLREHPVAGDGPQQAQPQAQGQWQAHNLCLDPCPDVRDRPGPGPGAGAVPGPRASHDVEPDRVEDSSCVEQSVPPHHPPCVMMERSISVEVEAGAILLVDDDENNVELARAAGMQVMEWEGDAVYIIRLYDLDISSPFHSYSTGHFVPRPAQGATPTVGVDSYQSSLRIRGPTSTPHWSSHPQT